MKTTFRHAGQRPVQPALAAFLTAWIVGFVMPTGLAAGPPVGRPIQDPQVVPAGGGTCQTCRPGQCRHGGHGHLAGCREGRCVPYCPVRPQEFGFYGTQWRRWPGQGVVVASDEREATPVVPPRLAVPGPEQESLRPREDDFEFADPGDEPTAAAGPVDLLRPSAPQVPVEPPPEPRDAPPAAKQAPRTLGPAADMQPPPPEPRPEPEAELPKPELPTPELQKPDLPKPATPARPEDENLFEARPRDEIRRRFLVGQAAGEGSGEGAVRPAAHGTAADPRQVPRVPFDPAAEGRRLRSSR